MNCKKCGYGLKQRCGDFEKIICTYEEGECVKITELENENRQLRNEVQDLTAADYNDFCDKYMRLEQENAELKEIVNNDVDKKIQIQLAQKAQLYKDQLTKAKEIIKKFSEFVNNEVEYDPEHPQEHTDLWNELCGQAEQFLKNLEK
jgi:predicted nuclease with TOPRIM domain